ncbi:MAG: DUF4867 family protein [Lachnospira sp.]|nr:DUF4867 family protein [Lachnospira sp.]
MQIQSVFDKAFAKYGKVYKGIEVEDILKAMKNTPLPEDVIYVPSDSELETLDIATVMSKNVYGDMPVQIGYCNGHNNKLNALEYHRSSEINIAVTDMILLLGMQQDIEEDFTYDTSLVEAFMVPEGTVVEMYATTLHYAPCGFDGEGFRCVVVLPRGTNYDVKVEERIAEDKLLAATNKWLIAHPDAQIEGAWEGLKGKNLEV